MTWFTDDAANFMRWWSMRIQLVCAALTGWITFDPSSVLWAWNMMPPAVRGLLPGSVLGAVGAVLFALNLAAMLARPMRQRKLEKRDSPA